jgi:tetratricopeptide (TPR) repeat protein
MRCPETMLAGGYTLAHDLAAAAIHVGRALTLDGGSAWAWGRSGWIHAYRGESAEAIERFRIARNLAPSDPLSFLWSVGITAAHFEALRYEEAVRWYRRGLAEQPKAVWINRCEFLLWRAARRRRSGLSASARKGSYPPPYSAFDSAGSVSLLGPEAFTPPDRPLVAVPAHKHGLRFRARSTNRRLIAP